MITLKNKIEFHNEEERCVGYITEKGVVFLHTYLLSKDDIKFILEEYKKYEEEY